MRILSLFDGMACGMIAMQLAGVEVESYDAYEIDKYKDNRVAEPVRCMNFELKETYDKDSGCVARLDMPGSHDIITRVYGWNGKCPTVTAHGGGNTEPKVFDCYSSLCNYSIEFDENGKPIKAIGKDGKQITVYEVCDGQITIKGKQYPIKLRDGFYIIRKLTVTECKRLQTVPEWYDFSCVSNSQAYKMLGNGWTCEVIKHLIYSCLNEKETEFDEQCRWF